MQLKAIPFYRRDITFDGCSLKIFCSVLGQTCGGIGYIVGRCGKGLRCNLDHATFTNPVGYCVPVLHPTTAPVQKLLSKMPYFDTGLHDAVDLDQQSGVARQNIPGVPVSNMANSYLKNEQTLPENETKYFVRANGMWSLDTVKILNDTVQPRIDAHAKNVTQNTTHHGNQSRQKIVSKGTVVKPSDYFCLYKPVSKGSREVNFSYFSLLL